MSVDQRNVVDAVGVENASGEVVLTISDHLDWTDVLEHVYTLQEKINDYLAFLKSEQIFETYPAAKGKKLKIQVHFKHSPPAGDAMTFLASADEVIRSAGFSFGYVLYDKNA